MHKHLITILGLLSLHMIFAQTEERLHFETEYQIKFSVGNETTQSYFLYNHFEATLPYTNTYSYPVNALLFHAMYKISKPLSVGIGSGVSLTKFNPIPFNDLSYYDKVMIPIYARIHYDFSLKNNWFLFPELDLGYQYTDNRWFFLSDELGFRSQEKGGLMVGAQMGVAKTIKKYRLNVKIGYEWTQFRHRSVYTFIDGFLPPIYQTIDYYTYFHLIKLNISLLF